MSDPGKYLTPEARARVNIDRMLEAAGWVVQDGAEQDPLRRSGGRRPGVPPRGQERSGLPAVREPPGRRRGEVVSLVLEALHEMRFG